MPSTVAIVPLFNHARTVVDVLEGVIAAGLVPIIVDDGSTDGGDGVVATWLRERCPQGALIRQSLNGGKARALLAGFRHAAELGATHALTVDADGQHDARMIPALLASSQSQDTLVLGDRRPIPAHYPLVRLSGRMLSGLAIRAACGAVVDDAACGMRVYPVRTALAIRCVGGRYAWEEEAVIRCVWRGASVREVAIPVIYREPEVARSHYRFGRDWPEGIAVLLLAVAARVVNPQARWAAQGAGLGELMWPFVSRSGAAGLMCALLAAFAATLCAAVAATCAWMQPPVWGWAIAGCAVALAVSRTRASVPVAIAGWLTGMWIPSLAPIMALIGVPLVTAVLMRGLRARHGRSQLPAPQFNGP